MRASQEFLSKLFQKDLAAVAAKCVLTDVSGLPIKQRDALLKKLQKTKKKSHSTDKKNHRKACLILKQASEASKREYSQLTQVVSITPTGFSCDSSKKGIRFSSETTVRRERDSRLKTIKFSVQRGLNAPALRWVDPIPLFALYESEIKLFCTAVDAVEEAPNRHANNAYLWPLQVSSKGIPVHSPKGTLLFIRGVKEKLNDETGTDSVLSEFVRIRNEIATNSPEIIVFHTGDCFELKHEIGVQSKLFPSWNFKTCVTCMQRLAKGKVRNSQEEESLSVKRTLELLFADLPDLSLATKEKVRRWVSNIQAAGQSPDCLIPQSIIDNTVPDILHLQLNSLKIIFVQFGLVTFRSPDNLLAQRLWTKLKKSLSKCAHVSNDFFGSIENFCNARAAGNALPDIHILGKIASNIFRHLPSILLKIRRKYFYLHVHYRMFETRPHSAEW